MTIKNLLINALVLIWGLILAPESSAYSFAPSIIKERVVVTGYMLKQGQTCADKNTVEQESIVLTFRSDFLLEDEDGNASEKWNIVNGNLNLSLDGANFSEPIRYVTNKKNPRKGYYFIEGLISSADMHICIEFNIPMYFRLLPVVDLEVAKSLITRSKSFIKNITQQKKTMAAELSCYVLQINALDSLISDLKKNSAPLNAKSTATVVDNFITRLETSFCSFKKCNKNLEKTLFPFGPSKHLSMSQSYFKDYERDYDAIKKQVITNCP